MFFIQLYHRNFGLPRALIPCRLRKPTLFTIIPMKVTKEDLKKSQIKLRIELSPEEVEGYKQKAAKRLSEQVKIPGFRPGTAPYDVVKLNVGEPAIVRQMIDLALPETYSKAILQEKIPVVSRPQVDIITEDPFVYEAIVALLPDVKVKDHKDIKVAKELLTVEDKDVDAVIDNLQKYYATYTPIDRPAKKGDKLEIDFSGTDESGVPVEGTASKNHPVILGENTLLPDFEKNLEGMKIGETKTFALTFPMDYHAENFRGKVVNFETTIVKAEQADAPELNDEFIEKVTGEKKTLAELKAEIRKNLEEQKKNEERMRQEDKMLEAVLERTEVEISDILIDEEVEYILEDIKADLAEKGLTYEQYLKVSKKSEADLIKDHKKEAEKRIKIRLALQFLFTEEKIEVTDDEVEAELTTLAQSYPPSEQEKAKSEYRGNHNMMMRIKNRVMLKKLFDKMLG